MSEEQRSQQTAVIDAARLMEVTLTASSFAVSPNFDEEQEGSDKFIDETVFESQFNAEKEMLMGHVRCRVWMNRASENTIEEKRSVQEAFSASIFSVEAEYFVYFSLSGHHQEEAVTAFFQRTACFTAWPYFRALVSQLSGAAGLNIPVLPIKRVLVPFSAEGGYVSSKQLVASEDE